MNGHLTGGVKCCLKGCENEAGSHKFDSMIGRYEMKCSPQDLSVNMENNTNLRVCDKHYASLTSRAQLLEAWLALTRVKCHDNVQVLIHLNQ